jgi:hypothetical protein
MCFDVKPSNEESLLPATLATHLHGRVATAIGARSRTHNVWHG